MSTRKDIHLKSHVFPLLVLLGITAAVYLRTLDDSFLLNWDDGQYVVSNDSIHGFVFSHLRQIFTSFYVGNYAPVQMLSYMLDYSLWGLRPAGFIVTNVMLHFINGSLFYSLLVRLTGRKLIGFTATFVFLFHPVQVESVAWISQRKNVLAMAFFLLALHLYVTYTRKASEQGRPWYVGSCGAFVLSMLSKSVAIVLIPILFLYDYCFVVPEGRKLRSRDKVPYLLAGVCMGLIAMVSQSMDIGGRGAWHGGTVFTNLCNVLVIFKEYLVLVVWPANLSGLYLLPVKSGVDVEVAVSALLALVVAGGSLYLMRRRKDLFFWCGVFFCGLLPVAQLVPLVTMMNDRYLYFPMLGIAALTGTLITNLLGRVRGKLLPAAISPLVLLLVLLPWMSWQRAAVWQDDVTFWKDTATKTANAPESWYSLGISYEAIGRLDQALGPYLRTLALEPGHERAMGNLLRSYKQGGSDDEGRSFFLELARHYSIGHHQFFLLGHDSVPWRYGDRTETLFERLAMVNPNAADDLAVLGNIRMMRGDTEQARYAFQRAQQEGLPEWEVYYDLACLEVIAGRQDQALVLLKQSIARGFPYPDTLEYDPFLLPLAGRGDFRQLLVEMKGKRWGE